MQLKELEKFLEQASYETIQELSEQIFPAVMCSKPDIMHRAKFRKDTYCRNEINIGNPKFSIVIIGWEPGQFSPIHNHPCEGCIVIPFKGQFKEVRFDEITMEETFSAVYEPGQLTYIDDSMGVHRLGNPSSTERAISLHIYSPGLFKAKFFEHKNASNTATV